jgi:hypothetical protein
MRRSFLRDLQLWASLVALISFPKLSRADDDFIFHTKERPRYWKSSFMLGSIFSGKTNYQVGENNGTLLGTSSDQANAYLSFGAKLTYQTEFPVGISFIAEATRYSYKAGGPSDGEFAFYGMPRFAQKYGGLELWAGVGLGVMLNVLGGSNTETLNGVTATLNTMSPTGFAWSPRVGVDIDVNPKTFFGAQLSYTNTQLSVPFSAIITHQTVDGAEDATRSWLAAAFRLGTRF